MEESPSIDLINLYLSILTNKIVNISSTIKHKCKLYYSKLYNQRINLLPKTKVIFIESFDHKYYILFDNNFYCKAASYQKYFEKHNSKKKLIRNFSLDSDIIACFMT